jgi:hypothetical protein
MHNYKTINEKAMTKLAQQPKQTNKPLSHNIQASLCTYLKKELDAEDNKDTETKILKDLI